MEFQNYQDQSIEDSDTNGYLNQKIFEELQSKEKKIKDLQQELKKEKEEKEYFEKEWNLVQKKLNLIIKTYEEVLSKENNKEQMQQISKELQDKQEQLEQKDSQIKYLNQKLNEFEQQIQNYQQREIQINQSELFKKNNQVKNSKIRSTSVGLLQQQRSKTLSSLKKKTLEFGGTSGLFNLEDLDQQKQNQQNINQDIQEQEKNQQLEIALQEFQVEVKKIKKKVNDLQQEYFNQSQIYLQSVEHYKEKTNRYKNNYIRLKEKVKILDNQNCSILQKYQNEIDKLQQIHKEDLERLIKDSQTLKEEKQKSLNQNSSKIFSPEKIEQQKINQYTFYPNQEAQQKYNQVNNHISLEQIFKDKQNTINSKEQQQSAQENLNRNLVKNLSIKSISDLYEDYWNKFNNDHNQKPINFQPQKLQNDSFIDKTPKLQLIQQTSRLQSQFSQQNNFNKIENIQSSSFLSHRGLAQYSTSRSHRSNSQNQFKLNNFTLLNNSNDKYKIDNNNRSFALPSKQTQNFKY